MNREERRKRGLTKKVATYNLNEAQIEAIKNKAVEEACEQAFFLMLAIPTMVLHDKFGKLMKKEGREDRFCEEIINLYRLYDQGYVDIKDLKQCLYEETGIRMEDVKF